MVARKCWSHSYFSLKENGKYGCKFCTADYRHSTTKFKYHLFNQCFGIGPEDRKAINKLAGRLDNKNSNFSDYYEPAYQNPSITPTLEMSKTHVASLCLQPEMKELLIACVKSRRAIWDPTSERYSDGAARRKAYAEVASILSQQNNSHYKPNEIQVEWKKMRDVFNRTLKKVMNSGGKIEIGWRYFHKIKFIASPEQLTFLRLKKIGSGEETIDPYGLRQFLESSKFNDSSLFKNNDLSPDLQEIDLDWIASRCTVQENDNDNASTKNDSSSYEEPAATTSQADDNAESLADQIDDEEEEEDTNVLIKKRQNGNSLHPDTYDAFGAFVASQLRAVSKRNRIAGANLQRAVLEICLKSELEN